MKKQILTMFTGLFIGAIITGGASAYAAGILAERSNHRIFVDGQEVQMEAYGIAGHNYVKLRDIGKAVGFNVFWDADSGCVQIETDAPYTGEAPSAEAVPSAAAPSDVDAAKRDIVARTNVLRAERDIAALTADDQLMRAAQVRADEMAATGNYSHTRPDGRKYYTVTDCRQVGENIHQIPLLYGITLEQMKQYFIEHQHAREIGDKKMMEKIEYHLTYINFHYECGLLATGQYDKLPEVIKNW